jgi:hypothetical protein
MSEQITFAHKYLILRNDQQKSQNVPCVPTAQNFGQTFKLYSNTLFSWLSDFSNLLPILKKKEQVKNIFSLHLNFM